MKNKFFIIMLISGIVLLPFMFIHWLFLVASVLAFISAILFRK